VHAATMQLDSSTRVNIDDSHDLAVWLTAVHPLGIRSHGHVKIIANLKFNKWDAGDTEGGGVPVEMQSRKTCRLVHRPEPSDFGQCKVYKKREANSGP